MLVNSVRRDGQRCQGGESAGRFEKAISQDRVRQLIEITHQTLDARIDQFIRYAVTLAVCVDQARDSVEQSAVAGADKRRPHRLVARANGKQHFKQIQKDILLTGDGHVRTPGIGRVGAEDVPWLINDLWPAGNDQRPVSRIDPAGVLNQGLALGRINLHAGDHEDVGDSPVQAHLRRAKLLVPLLENDPGFGESGVDHGRADSPNAGRNHANVGEDERQHSRAIIEGAGDHSRQVVLGRDAPQAQADAGQFARLQQLITTSTRGKFHVR